MPSYTFKAPDGEVWASEYEFRVYDALRSLGSGVRRCQRGTGDTFSYCEQKQALRCLECGSSNCVQVRSYTPDLYIPEHVSLLGQEGEGSGYYIEAKGYLREHKRGLLRHFRRSQKSLDLRMVASADHRVGKGRLSTWAWKYCRIEVWIWDWKKDDITDVVPEEWMIWE